MTARQEAEAAAQQAQQASQNAEQLAKEAGAQVCRVTLQGKGNVVRRMFADVQADVYVLVDGDGTYDAATAPRLVEVIRSWSSPRSVDSVGW